MAAKGGITVTVRETKYTALDDEGLKRLKDLNLCDDQLAKANQGAKEQIDENQKKMSIVVKGRIPEGKRELNLLLLGKTGAGKSATGNMIIGKREFDDSLHTVSCTKTIKHRECTIDGVRVRVIDTPGLNDTHRSDKDILTEIAKVANHFQNGIDGVLFVFNLGNPRFTKEEKASFQSIKEGVLGGGVISHCFVVLSHGNELLNKKSSLKQYVDNEVENKTEFAHVLKSLLGARVIAVDNGEPTEYGKERQRKRLVRMVAAHATRPWIPDVFKSFVEKQQRATAGVPDAYRGRLQRSAANALIDKPREILIKMSEEEKGQLVTKITAEVTGGVSDPKARSSANSVVTSTIHIYTRSSFLTTLSVFIRTLMGAAGQAVRGITHSK